MTLPDATASTNGYVLGVQSGAGTNSLQLTWLANGGGEPDTNFAEDDLTSTGNRQHTFTGHSFSMAGMTTTTFDSTSSTIIKGPNISIEPPSAGGGAPEVHWLEDSANGSNYVSLKAPPSLAATNSYTFPIAYPLANGYALVANTDGTMSWAPNGGGEPDTNFAEDDLTATGNRSHNFVNNNLVINNLGLGASTMTLSSGFGFEAAQTTLTNTNSAEGADFRLFQRSDQGSEYVAFKGPESFDMAGSYSIELPSLTAAANGQILEVSSGGGSGSLVLAWGSKHQTFERGYIQLTADYTAGTTINLDGSSANMTLVAGDAIVMTGIGSQTDLLNSKQISFWADGIKADVSGTGNSHNTAQYVSSTAISFSQDLASGTIIEIERLS